MYALIVCIGFLGSETWVGRKGGRSVWVEMGTLFTRCMGCFFFSFDHREHMMGVEKKYSA